MLVYHTTTGLHKIKSWRITTKPMEKLESDAGLRLLTKKFF